MKTLKDIPEELIPIIEERKRQIEKEGYTPEHDDEHKYWELIDAAVCYIDTPYYDAWVKNGKDIPDNWPWDKKYWKPTPNDRIRELTKAGALIAAEIARLRRLKK